MKSNLRYSLQKLFIVLTVALPLAAAAAVTLPFYESFPTNYTQGSKLGSATSSNVWNFGNNAVNTSGGITITNLSLSYPGLLTNAGSFAVELTAGPIVGNRSRAVQIPTQTLDATNSTLYASFLINVSTAPTGNRLVACFSGDTNFSGFGSNPNPIAGVWLTASNRLAISKGGTGTAPTANLTSSLNNDTHLVVLRYKYVAGQSNDEVSLWLDPALLGVEETNVPQPSLLTTTNNDAPVIGLLGSFCIAQSTNRTLYPGTNSGRIRLDEIRIANSWAQVTPLPPLPLLPPTIGSLGVSNMVNNTATPYGSVNPNGLPTTCWFEWDVSTDFTKPSRSSSTTLAAGHATQLVVGLFTNVPSGAVLYVRLVASNTQDKVYSGALSFGAPAITLNGANPLTNECHAYYNELGGTARWGSGPLNQPIVYVSGTVDTNTLGSYTLTYSATNRTGGLSTATRTVIVTDTRVPHLTVLGESLIYLSVGTPFVDPGATASDFCAGDLTASIRVNSVDTHTPGFYPLTYSATDPSGNTGTATRLVIVTAPPLATTLAASGVSNTVATLHGAVTPNGPLTDAWFEWGPGARWSHATEPVTLLTAFTNLPATATLTNLVPGVIYHARVVASNAWGVVRGREIIFGSPAIRLSGSARVTVACNSIYNERGAEMLAMPSALAAGGSHTVARKQDGAAFAWGGDGYGQADAPFLPASVVSVGANTYSSAAVDASGRVWVWGQNASGITNVPASATNCTAVALGYLHALALRADGRVMGWGQNSFGQLKFPASATNVTAIAAGSYFNVALRADGAVLAWGRNNSGQTNVPANATNVLAVAAGFSHALALRADRTVVAWGDNYYGQTSVPTNLTDVVAIAAGGYHSLALRNDGTVVRWGYASSGLAAVPTNATDVISIAAGNYFALAVRGDGSVLGWGQRNFGQTDVRPELARLDLPLGISGAVDPTTPGSYAVNYCATNIFGGVGCATRTVVVACAAATAARVELQPRDAAQPAGLKLAFTNEAAKSFTVLCSTNLALPLAEWTEVGAATETAPGEYQFTADAPTNDVPCFYRVRSP